MCGTSCKATQSSRQELPNQTVEDSLDGEVLQMCFLRLPPDDFCTDLPFLVDASVSLEGLRPRFLDPGSNENIMPPGEALDARAEMLREQSVDSDAPLSDVLSQIERALVQGEPLPARTQQLSSNDWQSALRSSSTLHLLQPKLLSRLVSLVENSAFSRSFLQISFPRALQQRENVETHILEPLPPQMSDLLSLLLRTCGLLQSSPNEFDQLVLQPLQGCGPLGLRAAMQASLVYSSVYRGNVV